MENVIILGGGLSGLGCALALPKARVFEASDHPGGHCYSHILKDMHFDEGAHICHSKDEDWLKIIFQNVNDNYYTTKSIVANYWQGNWVNYPVQNHLYELPLDVKKAALIDFFLTHITKNREEPKNYYEWCFWEYGQFLTENFYSVYTKKYWRVSMEELGIDWLSGRLLPSQIQLIIAGALAPQQEDQSTFSQFYYPSRGGFYSFVKPFYNDINILFNKRAVLIDIHKKIVHFNDGSKQNYEILASSIPLVNLVQIIKDVPTEIKLLSKKLRYTQLLCVNLIIKRFGLSKNHWFYVYDNDIPFARVSLPSLLAPKVTSKNKSALQAEIFRRDNEKFDVDIIVEDTVRHIARLLDFNPSTELEAVYPVHVPYAYIISDHDRSNAVETITSWLSARSIFSMGLYGKWKYIWSDAAFRSGGKTAQIIKDKYDY